MATHGSLKAVVLCAVGLASAVGAKPFNLRPRITVAPGTDPFTYLGWFVIFRRRVYPLIADLVSSYAEPEGARALANVVRSDDMTREKCASLCPGNKYFGVEWGQECWSVDSSCVMVLHPT